MLPKLRLWVLSVWGKSLHDLQLSLPFSFPFHLQTLKNREKHRKWEREGERETYCLSYAICSLALRQRVHVLLTVHTKQKLRTTWERRSRTTTKTRPLRFRLFRFRQRTADDEEMQVRGAAFANVDNATGKTHTHTYTQKLAHFVYSPNFACSRSLSLTLTRQSALTAGLRVVVALLLYFGLLLFGHLLYFLCPVCDLCFSWFLMLKVNACESAFFPLFLLFCILSS